MDDAITQGITVAADIDAVWALVATPGWWILDDALAPHEITDDGPDAALVHDDTWGTFRIGLGERDAPHRAVFTWVPDAGLAPLTVTFTLAGSDGGTDVTVVESGFGALTPEQHEVNYAANVAGWAIAMKALAAAVR